MTWREYSMSSCSSRIPTSSAEPDWASLSRSDSRRCLVASCAFTRSAAKAVRSGSRCLSASGWTTELDVLVGCLIAGEDSPREPRATVGAARIVPTERKCRLAVQLEGLGHRNRCAGGERYQHRETSTLKALCVGRHRYLSDHFGMFFQKLGVDTACVVGISDAIEVAREHRPDVVFCEYDLLATVALEPWEQDPYLSRVPVIAVSLTRRSEEIHLLDVNQ